MRLTRRDLFILAFATGLVVGLYLLASALTYRIGFPLDDSWIHQTYARNLALRHEWSFLPGQPSAGSTSPLWTFLLSIGFFLPAAPYLWTYLLGGLTLFGVAVLAENLLRHALAMYSPRLPWAGFFFILEWHMAWAAASGMETLLHILVVMATLGLLMIGSRRYLLLGLLAGTSVWVRPDGLTLLGPLVCYALLAEKTFFARFQALLRIALGFAALFAPFLLFNLALSGTPMPNTFYAKQAEYVQWQGQPFSERLFLFAIQFFAGPSLVVLWGFLQKVYGALRSRQWGIPLSAVWTVGYILLYISRLPVYQHARYLMPALGVFLLIGLLGFIEFLPSLRTYRTRLLRDASLMAIALFSLAFSGFGAYTFARDVAFIESEMVASAKWAAKNIPPEALVAAHDIGALGYFDQHRIIDLAGLISPEVVPFIRDEPKLAAFMDERGVDYLIAFPHWYPDLIQKGVLLYSTGGQFVEHPETENMTIYRWGAK
jgi:hypothetical protein